MTTRCIAPKKLLTVGLRERHANREALIERFNNELEGERLGLRRVGRTLIMHDDDSLVSARQVGSGELRTETGHVGNILQADMNRTLGAVGKRNPLVVILPLGVETDLI